MNKIGKLFTAMFIVIGIFGLLQKNVIVAQDLPDVDALLDRYKSQLEQIQSKDAAENFFWTHMKDDFGLTSDFIGFLSDLADGLYNTQIQYVMSVPEQRWNPTAGYGGWGRYERVNAIRIVNKNTTGTLDNLSDALSKIGLGLKLYGLIIDVWNGIYDDDHAKLRSYLTVFELYIALESMTQGWPGMGIAGMGAAIMSYAIDKFINTTLDEYNEYWWIRYRNYLENRYPSFVNDWYLYTEREGAEALERKLYEYWDSQAQFDVDNASIYILYRNSEYAKNMHADSFAAMYYRDYLHRNLKQRFLQQNGQAQVESKNGVRNDIRVSREQLDELMILWELIKLATEEMKELEKTPVSLTIIPQERTIKAGESVSFRAMVTYSNDTSEDITVSENLVWSTGSNVFSSENEGRYEIIAEISGVSGRAVVTVESEEESPVQLLISPEISTISQGETIQFLAVTVYGDGSSRNITESESTTWNIGSAVFVGSEPGTFPVTAEYSGLTVTADVIVRDDEIDELVCGANEEPDEMRLNCICSDGFERIDGIAGCVNLDSAVEEVLVENEGTLCDEEHLTGQLARLNEIVAESSLRSAQFRNLFDNFLREINRQSTNPCTNQIIATAFSGAKHLQEDFQQYEKEANNLSRELILEGAICPLENLNLDISNILQRVSQMGPSLRQVEEGMTEMNFQLNAYGCDQQEVADRGDLIAERTLDPEVLREGGLGLLPDRGEMPGTPGDGSFVGFITAIFGGDFSPVSSLRISVNFDFDSFQFNLSHGSDDLHMLSTPLNAGDRMRISVEGTALNSTITFIESDFVTDPESGVRGTIVTISVFFDENEGRFRMMIIILDPNQGGRVLNF